MSDTPQRKTEREPDVAEETGFLERWSRRKAAAGRSAAPVHEPESLETPGDAMPAEALPSEGDAVESGDGTGAELPSIESLTDHSDYGAFLGADVDPDLRRRALRRVFSAAKFTYRDGLDDYCRDFRSWTPLGDVITADMKLQAMRRLERELAAAGETGPRAGDLAERSPDTEGSSDDDRSGSEQDGEPNDERPA
jgi:hypothetical protein